MSSDHVVRIRVINDTAAERWVGLEPTGDYRELSPDGEHQLNFTPSGHGEILEIEIRFKNDGITVEAERGAAALGWDPDTTTR